MIKDNERIILVRFKKSLNPKFILLLIPIFLGGVTQLIFIKFGFNYKYSYLYIAFNLIAFILALLSSLGWFVFCIYSLILYLKSYTIVLKYKDLSKLDRFLIIIGYVKRLIRFIDELLYEKIII